MLVIVGGPSGCGKSTVGNVLATHFHCPFIDGDDLHPKANIDKMASGVPLTDDDRWGWLKAVAAQGAEAAGKNGIAVAACSALSRAHRDFLRANSSVPILFVMLNISRPELARRLVKRENHFMKVDLLDSQLTALHLPDSDESAIVVDESATVNEIIDKVEVHTGSRHTIQ